YGIIRGIGLSNDIGGNLLSPDSEGQVRAMKMAYESAGWNPWDVDLIECHGTGTPAGDATELASLVELWGKSGWSEAQCAIGSVKSMIGHLLTGAGAAGMIKTLLAMKHYSLPPSLHFNRAHTKSPIHGSPFRVQTETEKWEKRGTDTPRRAAVSAFGFGGINGHLLFEEWLPDIRSKKASWIPPKAKKISASVTVQDSDPPVAIVGMDAFFGRFKSLREFREAIFNGNTSIGRRPEGRWKGCDETAKRFLGGTDLQGAFIKEIDFDPGNFHIPPLEIPDILLQHLLILKVASGAMKDAELPAREKRPRMGVIIGADFDYGATDFQLRWDLFNPQKEKPGLNIESIQDACSPPLTSSRTLGALGGIIASRIAREFRFGGPSFVISCDAASGLKALEAGVRSVQGNETDMMLVGAVDLAGDVRNMIAANGLQSFTKGDRISPFDSSSSGTLPGEGAGAIIIKRLDKAIEDKDRIYAVIKGIGKAGTGSRNNDIRLKEAYSLSFERALSDASLIPSDISYFEAHGSGDPLEDGIEIGAIDGFYKNSPARCAIGSVKPNIGHAGSASGLASLIKAVLCLYHETVPPLLNFTEPNFRMESKLHFPAFTQFWYRDRIDGPRRACTASMTRDGNCMHILLEGYEYQDTSRTPVKVLTERDMPLVCRKSGLFIIEGNSEKELLERLDLLSDSVDDSGSIHECAFKWFNSNKPDYSNKYALSIATGDMSQLRKWITEAKIIVEANTCKKMNGLGGICYSPKPLGNLENIAFVFPGSGNHYIGMGRGAGIYFPEILRNIDAKTNRLKTQLVPECFIPWRNSWKNGWENDAREKISANPLNMIFGQVIYGGIISGLVTDFGIKPSAVIGYSLGESAGNFAMNLWPDHEDMLKRMTDTDLFTTELAGPCNSARMAWNIPPGEDFAWCAAAVNRPAKTVRKSLAGFPLARLLIVNTPDECVLGGRKKEVEAVIRKLKCEAVFLEGVVTVHCDAVDPVAGKYKNLHLFPVTPPVGIRFYSCALGRSFEVTSESAADSILKQAT
ncbi:MAG: beta-ketoacyl synthase N-terminal-like domain-containing protein, partial [Desulfobacterales bacterium]|nr:beta-ketoacyl synthase N-terminal-like domain-containing protein [Desulfobacterales bacterium]